MKDFDKDTARNVAHSFATALRNSFDPQDPDRKVYREEEAPKRILSFLNFVEEKGIDPATAADILSTAIKSVVGQLTDGTIDAIRDEVQGFETGAPNHVTNNFALTAANDQDCYNLLKGGWTAADCYKQNSYLNSLDLNEIDFVWLNSYFADLFEEETD